MSIKRGDRFDFDFGDGPFTFRIRRARMADAAPDLNDQAIRLGAPIRFDVHEGRLRVKRLKRVGRSRIKVETV